MSEHVVTLSVVESGSGVSARLIYQVQFDDSAVATGQRLTLNQSRAVRELSLRFGQLFEIRNAPHIARDMLAAIGTELFELWLAPWWEKVTTQVQADDQCILVISSDQAS